MEEIFFVDQNPDNNYINYRRLIEEQFTIAYASNGALTYEEVGSLTKEDRDIIFEVIKNIKEEESKAYSKIQSQTSFPQPKSEINYKNIFSSVNSKK